MQNTIIQSWLFLAKNFSNRLWCYIRHWLIYFKPLLFHAIENHKRSNTATTHYYTDIAMSYLVYIWSVDVKKSFTDKSKVLVPEGRKWLEMGDAAWPLIQLDSTEIQLQRQAHPLRQLTQVNILPTDLEQRWQFLIFCITQWSHIFNMDSLFTGI